MPVAWDGDAVRYLDQRLLPHEARYERAQTSRQIEGAIKSLAVRGAPCIGVFGAYGIALLRRTIGDDARIASPSSVRPVRLNSSPVIATVPAVPGGSLVPAGLDCGGGAVAQADKRTIMESNDFMVTSKTLQ